MRKRNKIILLAAIAVLLFALSLAFRRQVQQTESAHHAAVANAGGRFGTIAIQRTGGGVLRNFGLSWTKRLHMIYDLDPDKVDAVTIEWVNQNSYVWSLDLSERKVSPDTIPPQIMGLRMEWSQNVDNVLTSPSRVSTSELMLANSDVSQAGFKALSGYGFLRRLDVTGTAFSDSDVASLSTNIINVDFSDTKLSDEGLAQLALVVPSATGKRLYDLILDGTNISAAGLSSFFDISETTALSIERCDITDADLVELAPKLKCGILCLGNNSISGEGLRHLKYNENICSLHLNGCPVTNADIEELLLDRPNESAGLNTLNLAGTKIDDRVVDILWELLDLQLLIVSPGKLSDESIARLKSKWPHLEIQFQTDPAQKLLYVDNRPHTPSVIRVTQQWLSSVGGQKQLSISQYSFDHNLTVEQSED